MAKAGCRYIQLDEVAIAMLCDPLVREPLLARLKGLPDVVVVAMHAFKNALIPVFTLAGVNMVVMVNAGARRGSSSSSTG